MRAVPAPDQDSLNAWTEGVAKRLPTLRADLDQARSSYERVILVVSRSIANHPNNADLVHELKVLGTVASLDYELKALLLRLLEDPQGRVVWQKYLALVMWQLLEELPQQLGVNLRREGQAFSAAIKPIRSDKPFMSELNAIRNRIAAHLGVRAEEAGALEWSIDSIAAHRQGHPALQTALAMNGKTVTGAVHALGSALMRRHSHLFGDANI